MRQEIGIVMLFVPFIIIFILGAKFVGIWPISIVYGSIVAFIGWVILAVKLISD